MIKTSLAPTNPGNPIRYSKPVLTQHDHGQITSFSLSAQGSPCFKVGCSRQTKHLRQHLMSHVPQCFDEGQTPEDLVDHLNGSDLLEEYPVSPSCLTRMREFSPNKFTMHPSAEVGPKEAFCYGTSFGHPRLARGCLRFQWPVPCGSYPHAVDSHCHLDQARTPATSRLAISPG